MANVPVREIAVGSHRLTIVTFVDRRSPSAQEGEFLFQSQLEQFFYHGSLIGTTGAFYRLLGRAGVGDQTLTLRRTSVTGGPTDSELLTFLLARVGLSRAELVAQFSDERPAERPARPANGARASLPECGSEASCERGDERVSMAHMDVEAEAMRQRRPTAAPTTTIASGVWLGEALECRLIDGIEFDLAFTVHWSLPGDDNPSAESDPSASHGTEGTELGRHSSSIGWSVGDDLDLVAAHFARAHSLPPLSLHELRRLLATTSGEGGAGGASAHSSERVSASNGEEAVAGAEAEGAESEESVEAQHASLMAMMAKARALLDEAPALEEVEGAVPEDARAMTTADSAAGDGDDSHEPGAILRI
jgi:hypothetical protein